MCLDYELSKKQTDRIIRRARKRGYIKVFKICKHRKTGWLFSNCWEKGLQKAKRIEQYRGGWYAFLTKKAAQKSKEMGLENCYIKTCYTKPQWIKRLGVYECSGRAGIFTHLAFPDWNKGTMTVREFRQMCKEYKGK